MANSIIGALRVNLGLDSAQFSRGARQASNSLGRMRSQFTAVAGVAAALGAALAGLTVSVSRTAAEIDRFSQISNALPGQFQRWAAAASTVGVEQEQLADILKDVNDRVGDFLSTGGGPMADFFENIAPQVGITADAFRDLSGPDALQLYVTSLEQAGVSQQEMTFYLEAMASDTTALIPLLRDGGAAMEALGANAADLGGIMSDEAIASLDAFRLSLSDAGTAIRGVGYRIAENLAPAMTVLVQAFADGMREGGGLRIVMDALTQNIDVIVASVSVAVTAFGVRYVGALALATISTFSFAGALAVVRTALITTGIGALIVGAGFLVAKFGDLVRATGSFSAALDMLKDVASEVWDRMSLGLVALKFRAQSEWFAIRATVTEVLANMLDAVGGFANRVIGAFVGAYDAVVAAWNALPQAMARVGILAANNLVEAIGGAVNGIIEAINSIPGFNIAALDLSGFIQEAGRAVDVAQAASDAFAGAFDREYLDTGAITDGIRTVADEVTQASEIFATMGNAATDAAIQPLASLEALREALQRTVGAPGGDDTGEGSGTGRPTADGAETGGGGGGGAGVASQFASRLQALTTSLQTERETVDQWYEEEQAILADRRSLEILGEQAHNEALLRLEEEYQSRLAGIREGQQSSTLSETATFFGALQGLVAAGGQGMAREAAIAGAIQATINSYVAATQALADPRLGFGAKFAAYASVLATGLRGVAAIKSAGGKSGGGGASGVAASGITTELADTSTQEQRVVVDFGTSPEWYQDMTESLLDQIYTATSNGDRRVVVVRA